MKASNLLWLDLETNGSDETTGVIFEVGWGVSQPTPPFEWIVEPRARVVHHDPIPDMEGVVVTMHVRNGLLADVLNAGDSISWVEARVLATIQPHLVRGRITLAGSGVGHFDRRWINAHMPLLAACLHFAPFDVGQVRRYLHACGVEGLNKAAYDAVKTHRAAEDVLLHQNEAITYAEYVQGYHE